MSHKIVFLDRETLDANVRTPNFPHDYKEYAQTAQDQVVERCAIQLAEGRLEVDLAFAAADGDRELILAVELLHIEADVDRYVLQNADMPGFSRKEQTILSQLVLGHRGDVRKMSEIIGNNQMMWFAVLSLRLAALFCRARLPVTLPPFTRLRPRDNAKQQAKIVARFPRGRSVCRRRGGRQSTQFRE